MALIDATARFAARREEARHQNGTFGEQQHSAPELTLVETPQSLEDIFEELNELGELNDTLDAPPVDTYTGSPEEEVNAARKAALDGLLTRAGLTRDDLSEKTLGDIQNGMLREEQQAKSAAEYQARQRDAALFDWNHIPDPTTDAEREVRAAVTAIIEARGYTLEDYASDSREYMERWAREQRDAGALAEATATEVERSRVEREEADASDRDNQLASHGPLTDEVWDDALNEDRLRAQQSIRNYRPTNYVNLKDTNALIRSELKRFPGVKFSVRGDSYSGGASTNVSYVDGPPEDQVEATAKSFAGATFDGMVDLKSYHSVADFDADGIPVSTHYAADFVFTRREFSEDVTRDAEAFLIQAFAAEGKTFDPTQRNMAHELPQAFYARATEENGGRRAGGYGYAFRGGDGHYASELVTLASTLIANERWAAREK